MVFLNSMTLIKLIYSMLKKGNFIETFLMNFTFFWSTLSEMASLALWVNYKGTFFSVSQTFQNVYYIIALF